MKYENFDQVKSIVEQIKSHEKNLNEFSYKPPIVVIEHRSGWPIYEINTASDSKDEYANIGRYVVAAISVDLKERIDNLKSILEKL